MKSPKGTGMDGPQGPHQCEFGEWAFPGESLSREESCLGMVQWEFRGCTGRSHPELGD